MNSHNSDTFCTFWPSSNLRRGGFAPYYLWHPKRSLTLPLPSIVSLFRMAVRVQPGQQTANTAVRQRNARIGGTIVEIDGIPPSPPAGLQHELVIAPMPQIGRVRDPDVSSERRHGPMDQSPRAVNPSGQKGRVFVVRRHDDTEFLEYAKIFRECQRHSGTATRIRSISHGILLEFRHIRDARIFDAP